MPHLVTGGSEPSGHARVGTAGGAVASGFGRRVLIVQGFMLSAIRPAAAIDRGNPDPAHNDLNGGRNYARFTGGPYAAG